MKTKTNLIFYEADSRQNLNGGRYSNAFSGEGTVEPGDMSLPHPMGAGKESFKLLEAEWGRIDAEWGFQRVLS